MKLTKNDSITAKILSKTKTRSTTPSKNHTIFLRKVHFCSQQLNPNTSQIDYYLIQKERLIYSSEFVKLAQNPTTISHYLIPNLPLLIKMIVSNFPTSKFSQIPKNDKNSKNIYELFL